MDPLPSTGTGIEKDELWIKIMLKYGATYFISNSPMSEFWRDDLLEMKRSGMNIVKNLVVWEDVEPSQGVYNYDTIKQLLDICEEIGIDVLLEIRDKNRGFPRWFVKSYPDAMPVTANGTPLLNGACYNNPIYQKAITCFIEKTVNELKAYKCIKYWDIWNESKLNTLDVSKWDLNEITCFCNYCEEGYKTWCKKNPHLIKKITGDGWEGIDLPELPPAKDMVKDWRWRLYFINEVMTTEAKRRLETVRKYDIRPVALHDCFVSPIGNIINVGNDDWQLANCVEVYGITSSGPSSTAEDIGENTYWLAPLVLDETRSAANGKEFWLSEWHVSGHGHSNSLAAPRHRSFEAVKREYFDALVRGATGLFVWAYRTFSNSFCLINAYGQPTVNYEHMTKITNTLKEFNHFCECKTRKPEVAILFDPENVLKIWQEFGNTIIANNAVESLYRYLYDSNFMIDFIHPLTMENIDRYKVVFAPAPFGYSRIILEALKKYVKNGGILFSEGLFSYLDGVAIARDGAPPYGFQEVFGLKIVDMSSPQQIKSVTISTLDGNEIGLSYLHHFEYLKLSGASPLLHNKNKEEDTPVVTVNKYGKGKAIYLSTLVFSLMSPTHFRVISEAGKISVERRETLSNKEFKNYEVLDYLLSKVGIKTDGLPKGVRKDILGDLLIIQNNSHKEYLWMAENNFIEIFSKSKLNKGEKILVRPDDIVVLLPA